MEVKLTLPSRYARRKHPIVSGNPNFQNPTTAKGSPNGDWEKRATEMQREKKSCAAFQACLYGHTGTWAQKSASTAAIQDGCRAWSEGGRVDHGEVTSQSQDAREQRQRGDSHATLAAEATHKWLADHKLHS